MTDGADPRMGRASWTTDRLGPSTPLGYGRCVVFIETAQLKVLANLVREELET